VSAFREAARAQLEEGLVCSCSALNEPGKKSVIEVSVDTETAHCNSCGRYGPRERFVIAHRSPKENS
jgi:hypothetical protein